jgi:DNA-binding IclR family transcriptional regulator
MFHIMKASFKGDPPSTIPGTRAVLRVLSLLQAFPEDKPRRSLTDLAAEAGLNKSTAHRMLSVLEQEGFVHRSPDSGAFQLGPEMIVLGSRALRALDIREAARPELEFLAEATGEHATLESLVGNEVLILDEVRGRGLLGISSSIGTRWPAHATATGKVLVAHAEADLLVPTEGLPAVTQHTVVSPDRWSRTLDEVRARGFATNIEELEYGYASVAAPVQDGEGKTSVSLSVGGSVQRLTQDRLPALAERVQEAAFRLSERLGYRPNPQGPCPD